MPYALPTAQPTASKHWRLAGRRAFLDHTEIVLWTSRASADVKGGCSRWPEPRLWSCVCRVRSCPQRGQVTVSCTDNLMWACSHFWLIVCSFVNYHSLLCLCVNQASHANLILIKEIDDDDDDDDDDGLKVAAVYCICVVRSLGVVWTCDISVSAVLIRQAAPTLTTPCTAGYCRTRTLRFMWFTLCWRLFMRGVYNSWKSAGI